jgi:catechol 2,3-dioxygenase-like lactoylglutathione lyase family enzyme
MLNGKRIHTTLPTIDRERARAFYAEKLGLEPTVDAPGGLLYETPGGTFVLFPTSVPSDGSHTQMGFTVDDIEAEVAELTSRGIEFLSYAMPNFDQETRIASSEDVRAAWFKDSEGNLIGLVQFLT